MENSNTASADTAQDYFGYKEADVDSTANTTPATEDKHHFQTELNRLMKETVVGDDGKFVYPEGTEPWAKVAIANEKKFRDNQTVLQKEQQTIQSLTAENEALLARLETQVTITPEQTAELEELKHTDVGAYYDKRSEFEASASSQHEEFKTETRNQSALSVEVARREAVLDQFNTDRELKITDELVKSDVPPKYMAELEAGTVTFEQFLTNVASFIDAPKTANPTKPTQVKDLTEVAGGTNPSKDGNFDKDLAENYAGLVF